MLSDGFLSSWIGGSQCSAKLIASKRFVFIMKCSFRYRVGKEMAVPEG